jgi:hypothetical protein
LPPPVPSLRPAISTAPSFGPSPHSAPPPVPFMPPNSVPSFPPPPPMTAPVPVVSEPAAKKSKELMSEESFISLYGNVQNFSVTVIIPQIELDLELPGASSNSTNQMVDVMVPSLMATGKQIKDLFCNHVTTLTAGKVTLAANKIQLKDTAAGFLKDAKSLASYNLNVGSVLEFSFKTRGGKK